MRRKEFEIFDNVLIRDFIDSQAVGSLALYDKANRFPEVFPLNYVLDGDYIYMHTFSASAKIRIIKKDPNAVFSIYKEYSVIPSYFIGENEKSIDQFYKSIIIKGEIEIVKDKATKKNALLLLAKRFQPESELTAENLFDDMVLGKTAILRMPLTEVSAKFRFGQQLSESQKENVCTNLLKRGTPIDIETETETKFLNFNSQKK
mgnify:CR=1 FL=1